MVMVASSRINPRHILRHQRMFPRVVESGREFYLNYPRNKWWWHSLSRLTLGTVGVAGKLFMKWQNVDCENTNNLLEALRQAKEEGRGVITVMNHVSVLDDPLSWDSMLSVKQISTPDMIRWTLGAKNICFKNTATSYFFSLGQVLSTDRFGRGPFQPSLDCSVYLLDKSQWVHVYPEGFVHQPFAPHESTMKYFKWGVSRLVLEAKKPPIVLPIYGDGLQSVFPEDKPKKALGYEKYVNVRYKVGNQVDESQIRDFRHQWHELAEKFDTSGYVPEELQNGQEARQLRSKVAFFLRQEMLKLRSSMGFSDETLDFGLAEYWKSNERIALKELQDKRKN